jgi:uncharacterized membrane protein
MLLAGLLGSAAVVAFPGCNAVERALAAWDAAALTMLGLSWWIIARTDAVETRRRASAEDPGRSVLWLLVLFSSGFSLIAAMLGLQPSSQSVLGAGSARTTLCLLAVACAWLLTHSTYTLRYAHLFYRDDDLVGGLQFPDEKAPDDLDFAYFAFTIGMCYQVSDVAVTRGDMRRAVLLHAIVSFAYNTIILALALNLVVGLLGK